MRKKEKCPFYVHKHLKVQAKRGKNKRVDEWLEVVMTCQLVYLSTRQLQNFLPLFAHAVRHFVSYNSHVKTFYSFFNFLPSVAFFYLIFYNYFRRSVGLLQIS